MKKTGGTYKGKFIPRFPAKYKGKADNIIYRSSWERRLMEWADTNPNVLAWASEEFFIPYIDEGDGKERRYFPDAWMKVKKADGSTENLIIEVKPNKETKPPTRSGKRIEVYNEEAREYIKNMSKWKAAKAFCDRKGMRFVIVDEYTLGIAKRPEKRKPTTKRRK